MDEYINVRFSYNGNLGRLQQKTIDNKIFASSLLQNGIISHDEWNELMLQIHDYFVEEIQKVVNNPCYYTDMIGG